MASGLCGLLLALMAITGSRHPLVIWAPFACAGLLLGVIGGITWLIGFAYFCSSPAKRTLIRWLLLPALLVGVAAAGRVMNPAGFLSFQLSKSAFAQTKKSLLAPAPGRPDDWTEVALNARVGMYNVDEVRRDSAGNVWFRTGSYFDWVDLTSYGFVYRRANWPMRQDNPSERTSPFGAADLTLRPMGGGWYAFRANDDWY